VTTEQLGRRSNERAKRLDKHFQVPIFVAALLVIPVIVIEQAHVSHGVKTLGEILNWLIWAAFATELVVMLAVVRDRMGWLRKHPLEAAIVFADGADPACEPAGTADVPAAARVADRGARQGVPEAFHVGGRSWSGGHRGDRSLLRRCDLLGGGEGHSVWDGVWLAITTMTTVGYGDLSPHTTAGRLVAVTLMLVGIGFIALLTGAIAERFLSPEIQESAEAAEAEVTTDVGDLRAELVRELRGISARLQELERMMQRAGVFEES
jgi:voltage-gated potassium channel